MTKEQWYYEEILGSEIAEPDEICELCGQPVTANCNNANCS